MTRKFRSMSTDDPCFVTQRLTLKVSFSPFGGQEHFPPSLQSLRKLRCDLQFVCERKYRINLAKKHFELALRIITSSLADKLLMWGALPKRVF